MNIYEAENEEELVDCLIKMIEQDTGKKIYTMKILDHNDEGLDTLIVFEDKNIMQGKIKVGTIQDKMAIRMQGNFI